jgi:dipeptidyl aminopeptidase/acylaminoacyl peptidase
MSNHPSSHQCRGITRRAFLADTGMGFTGLALGAMFFRDGVARADADPANWRPPDGNPQFSPDGQRVTFCSNRSGSSMEVWVAAGDGSNATQLTHGPGRWQCSPRWSPDGKRIAFDSRTADGHWHIWTIDADGGIPHQVTKNAGDQNIPSWSKDGVWIYSSWNQGNGGREIWRTRASTGTQERVRGIEGSAGSFLAIESPDGNSVLYQPQGPNSALMSAPLASGDAVQLVPCVAGTAFSTGPRGIYYVACGPGSAPEVHVINPATAVDQVLGRLDGFEREVPSGFTVSPDGTSILYTRPVSQGVDLMLIENFR